MIWTQRNRKPMNNESNVKQTEERPKRRKNKEQNAKEEDGDAKHNFKSLR